MLLHELFDCFQSCLIQRNAKDGESSIFELFMDFDQRRPL